MISAQEPSDLRSSERDLLKCRIELVDEEDDFDWRIGPCFSGVDGLEGENRARVVVVEQAEILEREIGIGMA